MHPDDLIVMDTQGNKISGRPARDQRDRASMTVYKMRPDIKSRGARPPSGGDGLRHGGRLLNQALLPEVIIGWAAVPIAELRAARYVRSARHASAIPKYDARLMAITARWCYARTSKGIPSGMKPWNTSRASRWWRSCWAAQGAPRQEVDKAAGCAARVMA